ncbi:hypothetical protein [Yersinia proxima]|nr:hypothetical protein [Yersinia proxima]
MPAVMSAILCSRLCHSSRRCYTTYGLPVSKMWITSLGLHNLVITLSG